MFADLLATQAALEQAVEDAEKALAKARENLQYKGASSSMLLDRAASLLDRLSVLRKATAEAPSFAAELELIAAELSSRPEIITSQFATMYKDLLPLGQKIREMEYMLMRCNRVRELLAERSPFPSDAPRDDGFA